jgi:hypothetical protein
MSTCPLVKKFGDNVNEFIAQYEKIMKDDTLSEIDSADATETLKGLYAYRRAVKEGNVDFLNSLGTNLNKKEVDNSLLEESFKSTLGEYFLFSFGNSSVKKEGRLKSAKFIDGGVEVVLTQNNKELRYSFSLTSDKRSRTTAKSKSFINVEGFREFLDNYEVQKVQQEENEFVLGSQDSRLKLGEKYKEDGYVHGNLDHMKNTLDRLHVLGGSKATQEELDYLQSLLDKTDSKFFNDLKLYVQEEANKTDGVYRSRRIDVAINSLPLEAGNQQSEASVYVEEVIHSMTASAIHATDSLQSNKLKRRLDNFIELARKQVTWKSFLPKVSIDSVKEEKEAKVIYDYIFNSKNSNYEFIAKGLTVPVVIEAFKRIKIVEKNESKSFISYLNDFLTVIIDAIRGNIALKDKSKNVHEGLVNLAFSLGEINVKKNRDLKEKDSFLDGVMGLINRVDDKTSFLIELGKNKAKGAITSNKEEMPKDFYGRVTYTAKAVGSAFIDPTYNKVAGVIAGAYGFKPEGTIREIIGGLFESDNIQRLVEKLTMQSGYIDKRRNNQIGLARKKTLSGFKQDTEITLELEEALTEVIAETDLAAIIGNKSISNTMGFSKVVYDNKTVRKLLTESEFLEKTIKNIKISLKELDTKNYAWHRDQAVGLGIFMATHTGNDTQNLNSENIAKGYQSSHTKKADPNVVKAIDELATLSALQRTSQEQKTSISDLMQKDWEGVEVIVDMLEGFRRNSEVTVFKGNSTQKIKGYVREIFDDSIVMEIAPADNRADMEAKGFMFKTVLGARAGDKRNKPMALYITDTASRPDRLRGAARLNQITSKGTTITDLSYKDDGGFSTKVLRERAKRDIQNIKRAAADKIKNMEQGVYKFEEGVFGVVPVLDDEGNIVDYRYMMSKKDKKSLLKQDKKISEVVAKSFGSLMDKEESNKHNALVLNSLLDDMQNSWTAGNRGNDGLTEYSLIGPESSDPELRKIYYMLPYEFREAIKNRKDKTLAVRRDLLFLYFGYSNLSLVDFPMLKEITPKVIVRFIQFAEMMWMEMIKIVKGNILLKIPAVLTSNIFSNLIYSAMNGYNPVKVLKLYTESYRDIIKYNKMIKNVQSLSNSVSTIKTALNKDIISEQRKSELIRELKVSVDEINAENKRIKASPIHELVALGLDQNVEDMTDDKAQDTNKITSYIEDRLEPLPELVKDGLDILFMTRRTSFYKVANEFLETSDLIARDVQNRFEKENEEKQSNKEKILPSWWLEKQEKGYPTKKFLVKEERIKFLEEAKQRREYDLVEDFINYTKPSGKFEEYLNKVGILMFTKYVKRIQRIVFKSGSRSPVKTASILLALGYFGGFPTIQEQFFLNKDFYGDSVGAGNVFPVYAPTEQFMNFITPGAVRNFNDVF